MTEKEEVGGGGSIPAMSIGVSCGAGMGENWDDREDGKQRINS